MKNKNNNQNEFERLGGQKSGGGDISPYPPPRSATGHRVNNTSQKSYKYHNESKKH